MLALAVAATSAVLAAAPASATLIGRAPGVDPTTGFPAFYTDPGGLSLQPCLDGLPICPSAAADLVSPGGEGFYFLATSTAGAFNLSLAHEGAFFAAGTNQQMVFQRTQVWQPTIHALPANTNYVITEPYETFNCTTDADGRITKNPSGNCRSQVGGTAAQDFDAALGGPIGPFLTWDTFGSTTLPPPPGYIGDGSTPHAVKGSPSDFNTFRVQGPGVNTTGTDQCPTLIGATDFANCVESSQFVVAGKVIAGPSATVSASSLDFPNTAVDASSGTKTATYNSNGTVAANVSSVTVGGARPQDFAVTNTCEGAVIASGSNCTVSAVYQPQATGQSSATVTIADNTPGSPRVINLSGSSVGVLAVAQTAVDFGTVKVGLVTPRNVRVTNTGVASLSVSSPTISGPYTAQASACGSSLSAGAFCDVVVSAKPTQVGPQPGSLTISTGPSSAQKVLTLSGNGATGASSAAPISVSFPATKVGSATAGSPITVSNSGPVPMTVGTSIISGSDAGQFVLHQGTCANTAVQPGSSCVLVVQFAPHKTGVTVASLLVPGEGGNLSVPLSGTATAATSPPVTPRPAPVDVISPSVRRHSPAARATLVRRNAVVTLTFSEAVSGASRHTVALFSAATGKRVLAFVSYNRRTHIVTLDPVTRLGAHSRYRVILTPGIRDLSGNSLTPSTWAFSTRG
jgi:Bacterial Ig-like domain